MRQAYSFRLSATQESINPDALNAFVTTTLQRLIFDGEALSDLMAPLNLGWKVRARKEQELMTELIPILRKRAAGRDISGLDAYDE